jgi:hypothetical protein
MVEGKKSGAPEESGWSGLTLEAQPTVTKLQNKKLAQEKAPSNQLTAKEKI